MAYLPSTAVALACQASWAAGKANARNTGEKLDDVPKILGARELWWPLTTNMSRSLYGTDYCVVIVLS